MSNSDFEKQVQERMDELHFVPSVPVWERIETEINKRKKRRFVFLWLFMILLVTGGGYLLVAHTGSNNMNGITEPQKSDVGNGTNPNSNKINNQPFHQLPKASSNIKNNDSDKDITTSTDLIERGRQDSQDLLNTTNTKSPHIAAGATKQHVGQLRSTTAGIKNNYASDSRRKKNNAARVLIINGEDAGNEEGIIDRHPIAKSAEDAGIENNLAASYPTVALIKASIPNIKIVPGVLINSKKDLSEKLDNDLSKRKNKWQWGISVRYGISDISSGLKGLLYANTAYDAGIMAAPGSYNNNAANPISYTPSTIRPGTAYAFGLSLRKVYKNINLITGINYNVFSTRIRIGTFVDSANLISQGSGLYANVNNYYRNRNLGSSGDNYINYFHLLEIPVTMEKGLGKKSPFSVAAGLSIAALLSSTALHYDAAQNIYFKDNSLIHTTQIGFTASLHYNLLNGRQVLIQLGPEFNYSFTNVFKQSWYSSNHLFNSSLGLRMYLKK